MKGIELCEKFYLKYGAPLIHESFPEIEGLIAVALAGSGSECFGYDDEVSRDHDFEPGFCLFLPDEDQVNRKQAFALERAYAKLPMEFMGVRRNQLSPVGGNRHGVIRISDFFSDKTGRADGDLTWREWFYLPEQSLAEATNGKVFRDDLGLLSAVRERLSYFPKDVCLKKLAGNLLLMGQSGQYNYSRAVARSDTAAAQLSAIEFAKSAMHVIFLLNEHYMPYYKWTFRALRELPLLSFLHEPLEYLISHENTEEESLKKKAMMEEIEESIVSQLRERKLTDFSGGEMEGHAYAVNDKIVGGDIRNLHILYGV